VDHAYIKRHKAFRDSLLLTLIEIFVVKNEIWYCEFFTFIQSWWFLLEQHIDQFSIAPAFKVSGELVNRHFTSFVSYFIRQNHQTNWLLHLFVLLHLIEGYYDFFFINFKNDSFSTMSFLPSTSLKNANNITWSKSSF